MGFSDFLRPRPPSAQATRGFSRFLASPEPVEVEAQLPLFAPVRGHEACPTPQEEPGKKGNAARGRALLATYGTKIDPMRVARALVEDPKICAWLDTVAWGGTHLQSLECGGCLLFGEALVEASNGVLQLYGLGYANELGDPEEGSYEHIVAYDPSTNRYLDVRGSHTHAELCSGYAPNASWAEALGEVVIEPFNLDQNLAIPIPDDALRARAVRIAQRALR